jgi:hypothetical protein
MAYRFNTPRKLRTPRSLSPSELPTLPGLYVLVSRRTGRIASPELTYHAALDLIRQMPRDMFTIEPAN